MMADNCEHVISYWVMFQKFHSAELGGFAVISHWVPFLLLSGYAGALANRIDVRRMIQLGMPLFMAVSIGWGVLIATGTLKVWHAMVLLTRHGLAGVLWTVPAQLLIYDIVDDAQLPSAVRLGATALPGHAARPRPRQRPDAAARPGARHIYQCAYLPADVRMAVESAL
jgi:MFS family permease